MKAMEDVYAAGDIAQFPLPLTNSKVSIGHWQIAHNHGRVAAKNMIGKKETFNSIPYFWTVLFGKSLRYCGMFNKLMSFSTKLIIKLITKLIVNCYLYGLKQLCHQMYMYNVTKGIMAAHGLSLFYYSI